MLTESSTTDSRRSKNAWCKVATLQFTVHLMPEVTHDIMVRQVVDCKLSHESKAWFCSNLHLQIYARGANRTTWRSMVMMVGTMMLPFPSASYFSFFFFCLDSSFLFSCSLKSCSETVPCPRHTLHWSYFGLYYISIYMYVYMYIWQCFASSFPWVELVWTLRVFLWNRSTLETLCSDVCVK